MAAERSASIAGPIGLQATDKSRVAMEGTIALSDFNAWMISEQRRVFLLCLRMLRCRDEADSATQDAFLKAYRALNENGAARIEDSRRWLTRIAVNTCLDRLRSRRWQFWKRRPSQEDQEATLQLARTTEPGPEAAVFAGEITRRLSKAMERLSNRQRSVFVLRHNEDHSLEEIGAILGLDTGTVKAHLSRALAKLRKELRDLYEH